MWREAGAADAIGWCLTVSCHSVGIIRTLGWAGMGKWFWNQSRWAVIHPWGASPEPGMKRGAVSSGDGGQNSGGVLDFYVETFADRSKCGFDPIKFC